MCVAGEGCGRASRRTGERFLGLDGTPQHDDYDDGACDDDDDDVNYKSRKRKREITVTAYTHLVVHSIHARLDTGKP